MDNRPKTLSLQLDWSWVELGCDNKLTFKWTRRQAITVTDHSHNLGLRTYSPLNQLILTATSSQKQNGPGGSSDYLRWAARVVNRKLLTQQHRGKLKVLFSYLKNFGPKTGLAKKQMWSQKAFCPEGGVIRSQFFLQCSRQVESRFCTENQLSSYP